MLSVGQINLLVHLKRFAVADQETCLLVLDSTKTQNKDKLLYSLRPLVKNGYTSRRADDLYGLLRKGAELVLHIKPILTAGGDVSGRKRVAEVSHMAALLGWNGIPTYASIPPGGQNGFIPSAIWRTLRHGLISTTRFLGVLIYSELQLAVYHIGNGDYDWQLRAECSLHYLGYGSPGTVLSGILLVCDDGCAVEIGKHIIRRTLWGRKTLLKRGYDSNSKPVKYAKMPIRLRAEYRHVYLAEQSEIMDVLRLAEMDEIAFERFRDRLDGETAGNSDCECVHVADEDPYFGGDHHYLSLSRDLLYLTYFYNDVKYQRERLDDGSFERLHFSVYEHHIHLPERYAEWGTFLKLPVTVYILTEEEIRCLTISG